MKKISFQAQNEKISTQAQNGKNEKFSFQAQNDNNEDFSTK